MRKKIVGANPPFPTLDEMEEIHENSTAYPDDLDHYMSSVKHGNHVMTRFYGAKLEEQGATPKFLAMVLRMVFLWPPALAVVFLLDHVLNQGVVTLFLMGKVV